MKKFISFVGLIMLLAMLTIAIPHIAPVRAAEKEKVDVYEQQKLLKSIVFVVGLNQYFVNNQAKNMDAKPFIQDDRTFVPVRYLGNALEVGDDNIFFYPKGEKGDNPKVKLMLIQGTGMDKKIIASASMFIGVKKIYINEGLEGEETKDIDVAPILKADEGRTYLPGRYVAEALGYQVDWQDGKYVVVWPKGEPKPDITPVKQYVEQQQQPQQPVATTPQNETYVANGYTIPKKTDLRIDMPPASDNPGHVDVSLCIRLEKPETLQQQYQDAYNIMASKFGEKLAKEVVDYAKQKQKRFDDLPGKDWHANGQNVNVGSNKGNYWIEIIAWEPGV